MAPPRLKEYGYHLNAGRRANCTNLWNYLRNACALAWNSVSPGWSLGITSQPYARTNGSVIVLFLWNFAGVALTLWVAGGVVQVHIDVGKVKCDAWMWMMVVLKRAWKPTKSDIAMRNSCALSAAPTVASKKLIGKGSAFSACSFLLHARSSRWLPWSCPRRASMKCMTPERASAGMLRESPSSLCVLNEFTKAEIHFGSCVWFWVTRNGTETEESRSRGSISGEDPECNQTVTQKSNSRSQSLPVRLSKGVVLMTLGRGGCHLPDKGLSGNTRVNWTSWPTVPNAAMRNALLPKLPKSHWVHCLDPFGTNVCCGKWMSEDPIDVCSKFQHVDVLLDFSTESHKLLSISTTVDGASCAATRRGAPEDRPRDLSCSAVGAPPWWCRLLGLLWSRLQRNYWQAWQEADEPLALGGCGRIQRTNMRAHSCGPQFLIHRRQRAFSSFQVVADVLSAGPEWSERNPRRHSLSSASEHRQVFALVKPFCHR